MVSVVYQAPDTLEGAVELLANSKITAKVLAGGTDLIIQMQGINEERLVVDVKKIPGMVEATLDQDGLRLGPAMPNAALTAREDIKALFPGLVEAAYLIGSTQVQGRCSVGGNLCNSSPAADTIPALIANGAQCVIKGPEGLRTIAAEDFVTGVGRNCLVDGELLAEINIPRPEDRTSDAYLRFIPRTEMDIAVAGAAVSITLDSEGVCTAARVAIGAVAVTALLVPEAANALIGTRLEDTALQSAANAASEAANPITDRRGTIEFRKHVIGVLVKRAAKIAADRAGA